MSLSGTDTFSKELEWAIVDYRKQLSIIFGGYLFENSFNMRNIFAFILLINIVFTLISIPAVIKFGDWYTKTLK
jgi:hypothetical protein